MNQHWKKSFLTIAAGQTVSLIGSSAVQFSLIWWLAIRSDSPLILSLAGLVAFLPQFFLGPFAGVWVDRLKKKHVVIAADMFIGIVSGLFALWYFFAEPGYWIVFLVLGIRAVGNVFHTPAMQALVPRLVPVEHLMRANGWSQFLQSGAFMLGPVLGGIMYSALPMWVILITDLVGAMVASATVWVVKIEEEKKSEKDNQAFWTELKEGVTVFRDSRILRLVLIATFLSMVFFMPLSSLYPLMTSSYFKLSSVYGSLVEFVYALGMLLISLFMGKLGERYNKIKLTYFGLLLMGITSAVCGILPDSPHFYFWVFAFVCMVMGAGANFYGIPLMSYMQETIPPERMGRAFSLWGTLMSLAMPVGLLISGPVAERFGVSLWFLISGVIIMIITAVVYLFGRRDLKGAKRRASEDTDSKI